MKGKRILVTGAAGFVGQHVIAALAKCGHRVVALEHTTTIPSALRAECETVLSGDICDPIVCREVTRAVDVICHLAAYIPDRYGELREAERCYQVNALATLRLSAEAIKHGAKRLVYISAGNMYRPSNEPATEDESIFPAEAAAYYLVSKLVGEVYMTHMCLRSATDAVILRIGTPYGPGEPEHKVLPTFMRQASQGGTLCVLHGGTTRHNLVYVADVADAVAKAVASGEPGIYNVSSDEHLCLREVAEIVAELFQHHGATVHVKASCGDTPPSFAPISIEKARKMWGISPVRLSVGVRRYQEALSLLGEQT